MAKGKKTGGRDFTPGHNITRPKMSDDLKQASKLTMTEVKVKLSEFLKLSSIELDGILKDKTIPTIDLWIARIVELGIKGGDQARLNFMFDRLIGKVTDKVEHKGATPVLINYQDGSSTLLGTKENEEGE